MRVSGDLSDDLGWGGAHGSNKEGSISDALAGKETLGAGFNGSSCARSYAIGHKEMYHDLELQRDYIRRRNEESEAATW